MRDKKPDIFWVVAIVVALGVASTTLMGEPTPQMSPQQAGIIVR
jgi:hypothetical protein